MKISNTKKLMRLGVFVLIGLLLVFAINQKNSDVVKEVHINITALNEGTQLIDKNDVLLRVEREFGHRLKRVPIGKLNFEAIEAELEKDPFVESAEVYMDANEQIYLSIEQRKPLLRIKGVQGQDFLVDENGEKMPLSPHATPRVIVVTGNVPPYEKQFLSKQQHPFKKLFHLVEALNSDSLFNPLIEQINIDDKEVYTMAPKVGNQKILFGANENLESKLDRLKLFYQEGLPFEGWNKYKTINLTFDGIVVCKRV